MEQRELENRITVQGIFHTPPDQSMARPILFIRQVEIKASPLYRCTRCARQGYGSTVRADLKGDWSSEEDMPNLYAEIALIRVSNNHLPDGWASFHPNIILCPRCVDEQRKRRALPDPHDTP